MKVLGLDGKEYSWSIQKKPYRNKCSSYHKLVRELLKDMFSMEIILEEVVLPGSGNLTCDFYINSLKLMVEVHGEQHYYFSAHFHDSKQDFLKGVKRDKKKREWCDINNIVLVELPYKESLDEWKRRIVDGITVE